MASKKVPEFSLLDLVSVAHEVRQVIFFGTTVVQITGAPEAWIRGSKFDLMRVFQNLLKNSIESGASRVVVEISSAEGKNIVAITDNGPGMDEDRIHRAMHGGFTSKENGMGLGLSICRHLTGSHGGAFAIESKPGVGTTVRLSFPALTKK